MSKVAIQLLTLAITASVMAAPANAARKHRHTRPSVILGYPGQASLVAMPSGPVCPGLARAIDCRIFPPPIDDDPDRKFGAKP